MPFYVHRFITSNHHQAPSHARSVVQWWVLAFAVSKLGMALGDLVLAVMYFNQTLGAELLRRFRGSGKPLLTCAGGGDATVVVVSCWV